MNDEGIEVLHQPAAHSDADSFVLFRSSDVVVAGDIIDKTRFPVIDVAHGGSIQGEIDALNKLIELAIPPTPYIYKGVGTYVIPGHGRVCEQMEIVDYRDMVVTIKDNIADLIGARQDAGADQRSFSGQSFYENQHGTEAGPGVTGEFINRSIIVPDRRPSRQRSSRFKGISMRNQMAKRYNTACAAPGGSVNRAIERQAQGQGGGRGGPAQSPKAARTIGLHLATGRPPSPILALPHGHASPGDYQGVPP